VASYDWFAFRERPWAERFAGLDWISGRDVWHDRFAQLYNAGVVVAELAELRRQVAGVVRRWRAPACLSPIDRAIEPTGDGEDRHQEGFQFWLDILDPTLGLAPSPLAVAHGSALGRRLGSHREDRDTSGVGTRNCNQAEAARILRVSYQALGNKIAEYKLTPGLSA